MKLTSIALAFLVLFGICRAEETLPPDSDSFKISITAEIGDAKATAEVFFVGTKAVEFDPEQPNAISTIYDLLGESWRDFEPKRLVRYQDYSQWAEASRARTLKSLSRLKDDNVKSFVESITEPEFILQPGDGTLDLIGRHSYYRVTTGQPISERQMEMFFAYDRINAYRKAMLERKMPPFPQLAVMRDLYQELVRTRVSALPARIQVEIDDPRGTVEATVRTAVSALSETEKKRTIDALAAIRAADVKPIRLAAQHQTVTDPATGLMWTVAPSPEMESDFAADYCEALTVGGYDDWRLPTPDEFSTLLYPRSAANGMKITVSDHDVLGLIVPGHDLFLMLPGYVFTSEQYDDGAPRVMNPRNGVFFSGAGEPGYVRAVRSAKALTTER